MNTRRLTGFHAVREALRAGTPLRFIACVRRRHDARVNELVELARAAGIPLRWEDRRAMAGESVVAEAEAKPVFELDELLAQSGSGFLLALDGIEDPQNLGAILRSACAAGVDGVILPSRRAVGLTATVERVSAGALEHVRV
ncbi:MAG: TrmH family RNA methyltransferase, partial [Terriglobales bacterium]